MSKAELNVKNLLTLAHELGLNVKPSRNLCPECHHHSVSIEADHFRCWRCGLRGDRVEFLVRFGGYGRSQACQELGVGWEDKERSALYQQVFSWCQEYQEEARVYLESRHIDPEVYPCGYCPKGLLESKFKIEVLKQWGICSTKGFNLLQDRVVFPVYNFKGQMVHFQGRSLDPDAELRWLSTVGMKPIHTYLFNAQRWAGSVHIPVLFICEGITDTLSLASLGLAAVGTFGIYPPFTMWEEFLKRAEHIVLCYDNDRHPLGHPRAKEYISWVPVLENWSWVYRALSAPGYVLRAPLRYKDINEWVQGGLDADTLERHLLDAPTVEAFSLTCGASLGAQVRLFSAKRGDWGEFHKVHREPTECLLEDLAWR